MATTTNDYTRIDKFDGTNYHLWKFKMQMVLEEKDLWDVVDGTDERPAIEDGRDESELSAAEHRTLLEALKAWDKKDRRAKALICLSVKDSQMGHVRNAESAMEAWVV